MKFCGVPFGHTFSNFYRDDWLISVQGKCFQSVAIKCYYQGVLNPWDRGFQYGFSGIGNNDIVLVGWKIYVDK